MKLKITKNKCIFYTHTIDPDYPRDKLVDIIPISKIEEVRIKETVEYIKLTIKTKHTQLDIIEELGAEMPKLLKFCKKLKRELTNVQF